MFGTFKLGRFEFTAEQPSSARPHIAPTITRRIFTPDPWRTSQLIERRETQDRAPRAIPIPERGTSGHFGPQLRAAVISFGASARGAVAALLAMGVHEVTVLTHRNVPAVASPMPPARLVHYDRNDADPARRPELTHPQRGSLSEYLARHDIVVNCILQDTEDPLIFVTNEDLEQFQRGSLIVDVSCDEGMGFEWARPTSFAEPTFTVGRDVHYYAVDHSPSYLWNSATWEISEALVPHLGTVMSGSAGWDGNETIRRAIEIREGVVQNPRILSFQHREAEYPHRVH